jgi:hypothetical protein
VAAQEGHRLFTGLEYVLLSTDGIRLPTKMETTLKNNYAFSNVVAKFCEITSSACQQHDIKKRRHYYLTAPYITQPKHLLFLTQEKAVDLHNVGSVH